MPYRRNPSQTSATRPAEARPLNDAVNQALRDPTVRARIVTLGAVVGGGTAEVFDQRVQADHMR